jgi:predicted component of type VI protein secretion system
MMKFLCKDEFMHSGYRIYTAGNVYEITEETVNKLVMVDKNHIGGALRFFTPVDEEAATCMRAIHTPPVTPPATPVTLTATSPVATPTVTQSPAAPAQPPPAQPAQPPSRDTLMKEAKSLGIKVHFGISNNDLMMLITAARQRLPPQG